MTIRFGRVLPWAIAAVALAMVLVLGRRLMDLSRAYEALRQRATTLGAGATIPTFRAAALTGDSVTIGSLPDSTSRQVLLILTTTCDYCRATVPVWVRLADSLGRIAPHVRVVALSLDSVEATRRYAEEFRLPFPVVTLPEPKLARIIRAGRVPQTAVVDYQGRVLYGHAGVLDQPAVMDSLFLAALRPLPVPAARATPAAPN